MRPIAALLLTGCLFLFAAPAAAESPFGLQFFGIDRSSGDARIEGRGGVGYAYRDSLNPSVLIPTQLSDITRMTVGVTSAWETRSSEDMDNSMRRTRLHTPSVRLAAPLPGRRGGFGLGFNAERATQWTVVRPYAGTDSSAGAQSSTETLEREGTRFAIPLQVGLKFGPHVRVGGGLRLERGVVRLRYALDVEGSGIDPEEVREDNYSGTAFEMGFALHDLGPLSVAAHFIPAHDVSVEESQRGRALDARSESTREDHIPLRWGAGVALDLQGRWTAGADFLAEQWSEYEGREFSAANAAGDGLRDEWEWRVGVEREPDRRGRGALRAGFHNRRWHYTLGGNPVDEWGLSLGSTLPLRNPYARADIAVGYSRIGSQSENGLQESVFRITFSLAGGERWY